MRPDVAFPPGPRMPDPRRALSAVLLGVGVWAMTFLPHAARAAEPDGRRVAGYDFALAACTPGAQDCAEIFALENLPDLERCTAIAPVFDGMAARQRVVGPIAAKVLALRWTCTPRFELPEA